MHSQDKIFSAISCISILSLHSLVPRPLPGSRRLQEEPCCKRREAVQEPGNEASYYKYVTCTSSHAEKLWLSRLHWKVVAGPELANSTVALFPFTVTPSLIRCTVHILGLAV